MNVVEIIRPRSKGKQFTLAKRIGLAAAVIVGIALITFGTLGYKHQVNQPAVIATATAIATPTPATPTPTPKTVAALLDGTQVASGAENVHPLAVMIENHPDARPQSGLAQASLVYEAIAEGGITRFMAVFRDPRQAVKVGPVRSARTYYVDFATELNAFYAHVGGNMDALDQIRNTGVLDLDQFSLGTAAYHREPQAGLALEHTMYSSTELLWNYATSQNKWSQTGNFSPWIFQTDGAKDKRPTTESVHINFSSADFKVDWNYDPTTNFYTRTMAGQVHKDASTGAAITAKNIVLETVQRQPTITRINENGWIYTLTGTGKATVYENGVAIPATWKKDGTTRTRYYDTNGKEISFMAGTTWVEIIHPDTLISEN
jgi:hypothetical protein